MKRSTQFSSIYIVLILVLATGIRVWGLQAQSLSMDEVYEIGLAKAASIKEVVLAKDGFPPLYHLLLRGWLNVFQSDDAARWLSLVFGCLSVPVIWRMARRLGGPESGYWAALLLAVSPFHIWYSQLSRAYALFFLVSTLAVWFFLRALETDRTRDWSFYALSCLAGLYSHYFFIILVLVCGIIIVTEKWPWHGLKRAMVTYACMCLCALPLLWILGQDLAYQSRSGIKISFNIAAMGYTYFSFLAGYGIGPSLRELHVMNTGQAIVQFLPWLLLVGACITILGIQALKGLDGKQFGRLLILLLVPVLLCGLLSEIFEVGYKVQYVLWAAIPLYILMGSGLFRNIHTWPTRISLLVLCAVCALSLYHRRHDLRYQTEDTRSLSAYLVKRSSSDVPVFVLSGYMAGPVRYYLGDEWSVRGLPGVRKQEEGLKEALGCIKEVTEPGSPFWLAYTRAFHGDPGEWFKQTLLAKGTIHIEAEFAGIELFKGVSPARL